MCKFEVHHICCCGYSEQRGQFCKGVCCDDATEDKWCNVSTLPPERVKHTYKLLGVFIALDIVALFLIFKCIGVI
jgi:hypothetical protein